MWKKEGENYNVLLPCLKYTRACVSVYSLPPFSCNNSTDSLATNITSSLIICKTPQSSSDWLSAGHHLGCQRLSASFLALHRADC